MSHESQQRFKSVSVKLDSRRSSASPSKSKDRYPKVNQVNIFDDDKTDKMDDKSPIELNSGILGGDKSPLQPNKWSIISAEETVKKAKSNVFRQKEDSNKDFQKWVELQTHNRYCDQTVKEYASLKSVFKKRVQFSKAAAQQKEKLEKKCKIGYQETDQYTFKEVSAYSNSTTLKPATDKQEEEGEQDQESYWAQFNKAYEDSLVNIRDESSFFVHGQYFKYSKDSITFLSNKNRFRWAMVWLINWRHFENIVITLIGLNSITLGIKDYADKENKSQRNKIVEGMDPFFTYCFLFECVSKIMAQGFLFGNNTYLTDSWNWIDFMVVVTSLMTEIPSMKGMSGLRTIRLMRPLRSLTTLPSMRILIGTLIASVTQLAGIMSLTIFFFTIFAILGVSLWNGLGHYRCYLTEWPDPKTGVWELVPGDTQLCSAKPDNGGRNCPKYKGKKTFCGSRYVAFDTGKLPKNWTEKMLSDDTDINDLNYGLTNFDNILYAFLTIFQCITMEGWTKIMNIYQDVYMSWFVVIYFLLCIIICAVFLLNLTIAVMLMEYAELDKLVELGQAEIGKKKGAQGAQNNEPNHNEELRQIGQQIKLPTALIDFLIEQDQIQMQEGASKMLKEEQGFFEAMMQPKKVTVDLSQKYYNNKIVQFCFRAIMDPYFDVIILIAIIINTVTLALDAYPELPGWALNALQILNYIFTTVFSIEVIFKMIGLGLFEYWRDHFNKFDLIIVLISIGELFQTGPGFFSAFRAFRLFKIFKHFQSSDLQILIGSITFTLTTINDYVILLMLFVYVAALMGMSFFAGNIKFDEDDKLDLKNGKSPRANFDGLDWAIVTIFEVLMGESWNELMYQGIRAQGLLVSVFYILLFIFGAIIMLNLFLAILLGNFEKARNLGLKRQVFDAFRELLANEGNLNEALDIILGDMSGHVKIKILKWDKSQVDKIHKVGDTKLSHQLLEQGHKFIQEDVVDAENENFDIKNEKTPIEKLTEQQNKEDPVKKQMSDKRSARQKRSDRKQALMGKTKSTVMDKFMDEGKTKMNKYSYTVSYHHKTNPRIMRQREMNRQYHIRPFKGLKEILMKKKYLITEELESVNSDDYKDFQELEAQRKEEKKEKKAINKIQKALVEVKESMGTKESHPETINQEKEKDLLSIGASASNEPNTATIKNNKIMDQMSSAYNDNLANYKNKLLKRGKTLNSESKSSFNLSMTKDAFKEKSDMAMSMAAPVKRTDSFLEGDVDSFGGRNPPTCCERFCEYVADCSCFIVHRDTKLRQFCLQLAETPEQIGKMKQLLKEGKLIEYDAKEEERKEQLAKVAPQENNELLKSQKQLKDKEEETSLQKKFEYFILVLIVISSITLVMDNPLQDPESGMMIVLKYVDIVFTVLFTIEAMIKIIASGFLFNRLGPITPYLRNPWNILDFFVVFASLIDLVITALGIDAQSIQALKSLRVLRAMRPLRMISKDPGMKLVVNALIASIPSMVNVLVVCALIILIFSVMGVNFFKGQFYHCVENPKKPDLKLNLTEIQTKNDCISKGFVWKNQNQNFDNTLQALMTLFQMMTTEGWLDVFEAGLDSNGIDKQPKYNNNVLLSILFFMIFMIVGSQFIINLFVGVVIDNFQTIKEKEELDNMFVTEQQRSWIQIQKVCQAKPLKFKYDPPTGCREMFYHMVKHLYFEYTITFFILANTGFMAAKAYRMPIEFELASEYANYVFAGVFNLEMILKLVGLGNMYFKEGWNVFDMIIVIATDLGLLLKVLKLGEAFATAATVIRGFRIMRIFKLIRSSVQIRVLLDTVFNILPQIKNVMTLIVLLMFIFAALGINLFSQVMLQEALNDKNNFKDFWTAFVIQMSFMTGEDWNSFMFELANTEGYNGVKCVSQQSYAQYKKDGFVTKGCGNPISYFYFFSFTIVVSILIMNLSVAAVIEGLETAKNENMGVVQGEEIDELLNLWCDYDPSATGYISTKSLVFLLYELPPPLGRSKKGLDDGNLEEQFDGNKDQGRKEERYLVNYDKGIVMRKREALALLKDLKIKVNDDSEVHFVDVFRALIKRIFEEQDIDYKLSPNLNKKIKSQWALNQNRKKTRQDIKFTASEQQAGCIITKWARGMLQKLRQYNRATMVKTKGEKKGNKKDTKDDTQHGKEILKEQARILYRIIKQIPEDQDFNHDSENKDHPKIKQMDYKWKGPGGQEILDKLDVDLDQEDTDENSEASNRGNKVIKIDNTELGVTVDTNKKSSPKEDNQRSPTFKQSPIKEIEDLFGPVSKQMADDFKEGEVRQDDLKTALKPMKDKNNERVQIAIYNMEEPMDMQSHVGMIYEGNAEGKFLRNQELENLDKNLERRRYLNKSGDVVNLQFKKDSQEDIQRELEFNQNEKRKEYHKTKQKQMQKDDILAQRMEPSFARNWENIDRGASGKTIEMDERFVDDKRLHAANNMINNHQMYEAKYLEDLTMGEGAPENLLHAAAKPREELFGPQPKQSIIFDPAKAKKK